MEKVPSCIICKSRDGDLVKIKSRGIDTLILSSKQRNDQRYKTFHKMTEAHIHDGCRSAYNRPRSIATASKEQTRKKSIGKKIMKEGRDFDFERHCVFCEEPCNQNRAFRGMQKVETKEKILSTLKERDVSESFNKALLVRLNFLKESDEVQAYYHNRCMSSFYDGTSSTSCRHKSSVDSKDFISYCVYYLKKIHPSANFPLTKLKKILMVISQR